MSKTDNYYQYSIFDAIDLSTKKKLRKLSQREYQLLFLEITKNFVNDVISCDAYKSALHEICELYRKDYKYVKS